MGWQEALGLAEPGEPPAVSTPAGPDRAADRDLPATASSPSSARARRRRRNRARDLERGKRLDIQGLRAVAVVAVIVNHLTGHPQGGFVGVDVFFVISGYLITGHLLRERGTNGSISIVDFYKRRVRRLFPAALTVTVLTLLAAQVVFTGARLRSTVQDGIWATLFAANWRFIRTGTDYFQAQGPVSPLQHYWSLSVEEQFYLVWPVALLLTFALARALRPGRPGFAVGCVATLAAGLGALSLVVAAQQSTSDPVVAYFSTFTRGWELGLGGLLAVLAPYVRGNRWVLTAVSWLGLALITVSVFAINAQHFPYPGALLPCLGSALVVTAASRRARALNGVLTNPVSVYLGDISYSLYVVHFPVIVVAAAVTTDRSVAFYLGTTFLLLALSVLLYHLVEDPIRRSAWLKPRRERGENIRVDRHAGRFALAGAAAGVVGVAVLSLGAPDTATGVQYAVIAQAVQAATAAPSGTGTAAPAPALAGPEATALQGRIRTALQQPTWPALTPPLDDPAPTGNRGCATVLKPAAVCTWGSTSAPRTMYLVGDSTSAAYIEGFAALAQATPGWKMRAASGAGCAFANVVLNSDPGNPWAPACAGRNAALVAEIKNTHPDLLVVTDVRGDDQYTAGVGAELAEVAGSVGRIVILPPPPQGKDPSSCYTKVSTPSDCVSAVPSEYAGWLRNDAALAARFHGTFVDTTGWYCVDGFCPVFEGGTPMKIDRVHITPTYAAALAPVIGEQFRKDGLLPAV